MCSGSWPNFDAWLQTAWGAGAEFWASCGFTGAATNLVFGQNPPYALDDFLAVYPKFFGQPVQYVNATLTNASKTIAISNTGGLMLGQFLQAAGLPTNTVITGVSGGSITVSNAATAGATNVVLIVYPYPVVPIAVLTLYIALATASLQQVRWQEQWYIAMSWFVAHYATLYARSDALEIIQTVAAAMHGEVPAGARPGTAFTLSAEPPNGTLQTLTKNGSFLTPGVDYTLTNDVDITTTVAVQLSDSFYATWPVATTVNTTYYPNAAQVAAQGLANGILTSKSVDSVSASYSVLTSLEDWGQWNLTLYGQQLATMAKVVGSGPMVIW
jgi:hypothetical protein